MITVKSHDLWPELERLYQESNNIKAAVAYVSDDSFLSFREGDVLVVDASKASIAGGRTSASVLRTAYKKGAKLFSCETLHGKVIVFDHHAYIGSANLSKNSRENLDEVGVISDHPSIMAGAIQLIDELVGQSIEMDDDFINAISEIEVKPDATFKMKPKNVKIREVSTWLVSLRNDVPYPGDEPEAERANTLIEINAMEKPAWFWMDKGNSFFNNAKVGDAVVIIDREKSASKKPEYVYRHLPIKALTSDESGIVKAYHYTHPEDHCGIPWRKFLKLANRAGIFNLGSGLNTVRELSEKQSNALLALWD